MPYKDISQKREWQRQWNKKMRLVWKKQAIERLGGKCVRCGYSNNIHALQIDHIEPQLFNNARSRNKYGQVHYTHGGGLLRAVAKEYITTENLQLLCANCHAIKTYEEDRHYIAEARASSHQEVKT